MTGYVDPFAHRRPAYASDEPGHSEHDDDVVITDDDVDDAGGLEAIEDDQESGRREAPFADDPEHRVRPVSR